MDRGAWRATLRGLQRLEWRLSDLHLVLFMQSMVSGPVASAPPGNLVGKQTIGPTQDLTESYSLGVGSRNLCLTKCPVDCWVWWSLGNSIVMSCWLLGVMKFGKQRSKEEMAGSRRAWQCLCVVITVTMCISWWRGVWARSACVCYFTWGYPRLCYRAPCAVSPNILFEPWKEFIILII